MRVRDFGFQPGKLLPGTLNAITDVAGVRVGHTTLIEGETIRTGVTAIMPHAGNLFTQKVPAAVHTINGFGKACGFEQVRELGTIETPILLTNTLAVGRTADACLTYTLRNNPQARSVNPVVGECNDAYLNDIAGRHIREEHVLAAIEQANGGAVAEGCVGAGTGTICYGFKGGIGTASRIAGDYTVGVLVQTNFGARDELLLCGMPVAESLPPQAEDLTKGGSVMIIIACDAPLTARQLTRLTHRAAFGLGRTGTVCHHGSGDFVIAFSTAYTLDGTAQQITCLPDEGLNGLFQGVVESVEEAVYNSLIAAHIMTGYQGHRVEALPHEHLRTIKRYYDDRKTT
jgi:D-aminopeptidase